MSKMKEAEATRHHYPANGQVNRRTNVRIWIVVGQNGHERVWLETWPTLESGQPLTHKWKPLT